MKHDVETFEYTCPFCGDRMKPHISVQMPPRGDVHRVDRQCRGCGWWDLDEEGQA